ncbi:DUF3046 domain-containing protein [Microbacterium sp. BWT-B31]|uniref:DUF3046 domain-containing protein n=1 Tax=Microbacterium sp. BWT-B31 TaxID=3232072 RepID=UPI0035278CB7
MRLSEFDRAMADQFGAGAGAVRTDLALAAMGGRTAAEALAAGVAARDVWLAVCDEMDVPAERRYGVGRLEQRRH